MIDAGETIEFCMNRSATAQIVAHLEDCDDAFAPPLTERVNIDHYAKKLADRAQRFEAWGCNALIGLVAVYCNDSERCAFISNVSVLPEWQGQGIASKLVDRCIDYMRERNILRVDLEVDERNSAAISLYRKHGFVVAGTKSQPAIMYLHLK
jgi:ribosomal protein S18 acetylase RimI-like enzyme